MSFRFSTPGLLGFLALVLLVSCGGLSTKDHPPLVYAVNLSSETTSLSLVKGEHVLLSFLDVAPLESKVLTKVVESDSVFLRSDAQGRSTQEWTDPAGTPYGFRLQAGHLYAIVVDPLGQAALYSLPETYSSDPKLSLVNATPTTLSQVQVAPDWAKNVKVYAQDVVPMVPSEFYSLDPKTLGLYWQTLDQADEGSHTAATDSEGKPLRQTFEIGRYYLFLAGDGSVRDLTPLLD